jgi:hypothetical protein
VWEFFVHSLCFPLPEVSPNLKCDLVQPTRSLNRQELTLRHGDGQLPTPSKVSTVFYDRIYYQLCATSYPPHLLLNLPSVCSLYFFPLASSLNHVVGRQQSYLTVRALEVTTRAKKKDECTNLKAQVCSTRHKHKCVQDRLLSEVFEFAEAVKGCELRFLTGMSHAEFHS